LPQLYAKVQEQAPARMGFIQVQNPGDGNAGSPSAAPSADSVAYKRSANWTFDGVSGALLSQGAPESAAMMASFTFVGLHMGNFAGPWLRWLYFAFGVAGTAVIGTGLVMWLGKRQLKHAKSGHMPVELRLVEVLNIASMSGLLLGVAAFFWANRLLPVALQGVPTGRSTPSSWPGPWRWPMPCCARAPGLGRAVGAGRAGLRPVAAAQRPDHRPGLEPFHCRR
jgi:hypothetical protein